MRAAFHSEQGGVDVLQVGDLPEPKLAADGVLIGVRAAAMDRVDVYWRAGTHGMKIAPPHVGGRDMSGVLLAVGEQAQRTRPELVVGMDVVAMAVTGAHADVAAAPAVWTFPKPANCTYEQAAAIPTAGRSAFDALINRAAVRPGEVVLVTAGGSGVGSFGIQIAVAAGAKVITTVGDDSKRQQALQLGAFAAIDHYREDVAARVREITHGAGVNVVLDHVGQPMFEAALTSLSYGGRYVTTGVTAGHRAEIHLGRVFERGLSIQGVGRPDPHYIRRVIGDLLRQVEDGRVVPVVHKVLPLAEIAAAHEILESSSFFGKVVLSIPAAK